MLRYLILDSTYATYKYKGEYYDKKKINLDICFGFLLYPSCIVHHEKYCAYGFVKAKNNVKNARLHINKQYVFKTDLKDFFLQA